MPIKIELLPVAALLADEAVAVKEASSLSELCEALRVLESGIKQWNERSLFPIYDNVRIDELIDITELKTFGGVEPRDTAGIWSWDATHLLVRECGDWKTDARPGQDEG